MKDPLADGAGGGCDPRVAPGVREAREARKGPERSMTMSDFSLDLNEDQLQIQKWVHDFAENVIRPAAHEWDEREETPWPIIEEAAKVGIYGLDFVSQCFMDPTGILLP